MKEIICKTIKDFCRIIDNYNGELRIVGNTAYDEKNNIKIRYYASYFE